MSGPPIPLTVHFEAHVMTVDLKTEDVKNLSRKDLETLAAGMTGYPPGRAGAAKEEILRRDREYAEQQEESRRKFELKLAATARTSARAAAVAAFFSAISALAGVYQAYQAYSVYDTIRLPTANRAIPSIPPATSH
jgi:hypothetical protein